MVNEVVGWSCCRGCCCCCCLLLPESCEQLVDGWVRWGETGDQEWRHPMGGQGRHQRPHPPPWAWHWHNNDVTRAGIIRIRHHTFTQEAREFCPIIYHFIVFGIDTSETENNIFNKFFLNTDGVVLILNYFKNSSIYEINFDFN